jgi:ubiquinone/menaquinone biosynthesis C-methylase UbiE
MLALKKRLAGTGNVGLSNRQVREAWLERTLKSLPPGTRILDAGAGELQYKRLCTHLNYVSQDFAQYNGLGNQVGLQTGSWNSSGVDIISDISAIPEPDQSFNAILCVEVLEHLPNPTEALREFGRLLCSEGHLILTAPFASLTHFAPYFYQTGYSRYFYEYWLRNLGFSIVSLEANGNYFEWLAQELRRLPEISYRYGGVKPDWYSRWALRVLIKFLGRSSSKDSGSDQLLAYGWHVYARKHPD